MAACDVCGNPATHGCTDVLQREDAWSESEERRGCKAHPVEAMVRMLDGRVMTVREWEHGL